MSKRFTLWSSVEMWSREEVEEAIKEYQAEYPDDTEEEAYNGISEDNSYYFDDTKSELGSISLPDSVIIIGKIGRWNGTVSGYKEVDSLEDCMDFGCCDYKEWYIDRWGNFRSTGYHHDGRNDYLYRMWKPEISEEQRENFRDKIYYGKVTPGDISRYTTRLGDYIAEHYGWEISRKRTVKA